MSCATRYCTHPRASYHQPMTIAIELHYTTSHVYTNRSQFNIQLTHAFTPSTLLIRNDSHKHAHHAAMEGSTSKETHFQYAISPNALLLFLRNIVGEYRHVLTISQCDDCLRCLRVKNAACPTPDGVCFVEGGDGQGGRDSCLAVEDEDGGGGAAGEGEGGLKKKWIMDNRAGRWYLRGVDGVI